MSTRPVDELLYDSEGALRLVDSALREFKTGEPEAVPPSSDATRAPRFAIERGHQALLDVIDHLRQGRSFLERAAVGQPARGGAPGQEPDGDQLDYATAVLEDVEHRLAAIVAGIGSRSAFQ